MEPKPKGLFRTGLILMIVSAVAGIGLFVYALFSFGSDLINAAQNLSLEDLGSTVTVDAGSSGGAILYRGEASVADVECEAVTDTGNSVSVQDMTTGSSNIELNGDSYDVIGFIEVPSSSDVQVTCAGPEGQSGSFSVAAISLGKIKLLLYSFLGFLPFFVGLVLFIVGLVQRSRWKKQGGGAVPPYPGSGFGPPGGSYAPPGYTPPGQPPAGYAPPGQPPAGYAPPGQPPAGYAPPGQPPAGYAPPGQPPAGYAPPGQPPAGFGPAEPGAGGSFGPPPTSPASPPDVPPPPST